MEKYSLKKTDATPAESLGTFKDNASVVLRFIGNENTARSLVAAIHKALAHITDSG